MQAIYQQIANELSIQIPQVEAAVTLLNNGATVPFISRYRKEATGGLSDTTLRQLEERLHYLHELTDRKQVILTSIREQDKLTPELEKSILEATNKSSLEDLYLPYKPKRRTKAEIAREAGLEALANQLLTDPSQSPDVLAATFINQEKHITTSNEALDGARYILMETLSENARLIGEFRDYLWTHGLLKSEVMKGKEEAGAKFADYFEYQELINKIPSHRALALFRGQRESILNVNLMLDETKELLCREKLQAEFNIQDKKRPADAWLIETARLAWRIKLYLKLEMELTLRLRELAEEEAIKVFAQNLHHLLMAAPAGSHVTLGLDPGLRTGVKAVVIDATGKLLDYTTIFPHPPRNDWNASIKTLAALCKTHRVTLVSIGNGTASRETDKLVSELKKQHPESSLTSLVVSEAGASVYSASELAALEFPNLDVTYRGAVSIARRLQDPLAELVKIEPKSIGVGQYQHDLNQYKLTRTLRAVMEDCVNAVGVNVNTASAPLLACVAGINETIASNIIAYRDQHGAFKNRLELKKIPRLGEKTFEQAAGFMRIQRGDNPLDASAVHPEAYSIVEKILSDKKLALPELMGNSTLLKTIQPTNYINQAFGLPTITDILRELEKPGRDPRPEFKTATFKEGIETLNDLSVGMILEGVVTNVSNFGAFVDIGVHQDGLVHISMLADRFVKDPHEVVKVGDIVKVKVLEVDLTRKRIQLSMRLTDNTAPAAAMTKSSAHKSAAKPTHQPLAPKTTLGNALLAALKK